ncbi:MAG: hypothetical protein U9R49_01730 [Bacteroidota bacterium]|nr:hypothetical protein [Bacteroidota bacterium]
MDKLIKIILCHNCGSSFERDLSYRDCSNCFACTGCEIYTCPECAIEIAVKPKKQVP